jgi:UDP-N-acetylmuramoyl-L-alanyl-D-glutamate--2,6-diaminopimelate ligase
MRLVDLLETAGLRSATILGNPDAMITGVSTHAQRTQRNEMFVAITGTTLDSHMLVPEAWNAGAAAFLVEKDAPQYPGATTVVVPNTRQALGHIAHAFHNHPTRAMKVCGVTGTNGKTTTTHLIYDILRFAGMKAGLIGTLGASFGERSIPTGTTTPDPLGLAMVLAEMEQDNVEAVVMEVSSHGIDQGRVNGMRFRAGALTNITQDHLDYHGTFENYANCKKRFFREYVAPNPGSVSCINLDDPAGVELAENYPSDYLTYSAAGQPRASVLGEDPHFLPNGIDFTLCFEDERIPVRSPLVGPFNLSNMLCAAACCHSLGVGLKDIARGLENVRAVPGRFEYISEGQPFTVIVDYAHTPDALERTLRTARRICGGRLLTVFGCGGDRDRGKRPVMGKIAGDFSDFVVVTNDNPRTENPQQIARNIVEGILQSSLKSNRYHIVLDRFQAIDQALNLAVPGDVVLIAGKGHEDYQDIGVKRLPFDDRAVSRQILREMLFTSQKEAELVPLRERLA